MSPRPVIAAGRHLVSPWQVRQVLDCASPLALWVCEVDTDQ